MQTTVGIDLGTQSVKVIFYDFEAGEVVASESAALDLYQSDDGTSEQQAHWWLNALQEACRKIDSSICRTAVALSVSGQQHGFVALGRGGEVLAPVKLWCDTATALECGEIMTAFGGPERCLQEVGNLILPGYTASKIRWLAKQRPGLYEQLDCILLPHDYLNFYLTGERCMEAGDASGTGFLDIRNREWSRRMLQAIDPDRDLLECLPPLLQGFGIIGKLLDDPAEALGLPPGLPIASGGGDNMMGAIGTGNIQPGRLTVSLGTSGTVYAHSDEPVIDELGEIAAFCSSIGAWLPLMCTMNCTVSTELMRRVLGLDFLDFETQVSRAPAGSEGVITLPFFNGERTPNLPHAKACIVGLDSQNAQPGNLLRSAMEGATFALRHGIDRLKSLGIQADEIILTGGGVRSATWRQVVADICHAPVIVLQQDEGASFGAALQARCALDNGSVSDLQSLSEQHLLPNSAKGCIPQRSAVSLYQDSYDRYRSALSSITPLYQ